MGRKKPKKVEEVEETFTYEITVDEVTRYRLTNKACSEGLTPEEFIMEQIKRAT